MNYTLYFDRQKVDEFTAESEAEALSYVKQFAEMRGMEFYQFKWKKK